MPKIAFLFPGQGSQYVGMGKTLCDKFTVAKEVFTQANDVLGYDLKSICFHGPHDKLSSTVNTQPAILTASVAAFQVFMVEFGLEPDIMAGHSFGTLSALVCCGAMDFSTALKLARLKGRLSQEAVAGKKSAMLAVENVDLGVIENVCAHASQTGQGVFVGIINSSRQIVVSGDELSVKKAAKLLEKNSARSERLPVSAPFHTPLLKGAAAKMQKELVKYKLNRLQWPVLSSISGQLYQEPQGIADDLYLDLIKPTDWLSAVKYLVKNKVVRAIEIGPKAVLKKITEAATDKIKIHSFISPKDLEPLKRELKLDKKNKMEVLIAILRIVVTTKNNNDNLAEFEKGVTAPYRQVKELLLELRKKDKEPTIGDIVESLEKLDLMMKTKLIPEKERAERLRDEIFGANEMLLHIPKIRRMFRGVV